nr:helix-turn-helix domain-containing protein [Haloferax larsenii]
MSNQQEAHSDTPTPLEELPPSAKLVAKTLEYEGDLTQSQLADETMLPSRTVRNAVAQLQRERVITAQISFRDARQKVYSLITTEALRTE